jgi:hypothetical protein
LKPGELVAAAHLVQERQQAMIKAVAAVVAVGHIRNVFLKHQI